MVANSLSASRNAHWLTLAPQHAGPWKMVCLASRIGLKHWVPTLYQQVIGPGCGITLLRADGGGGTWRGVLVNALT